MINEKQRKRFLRIIIWTGLVRLHSICLYWSHDPASMEKYPKKYHVLKLICNIIENGTFDRESNGSNRLSKIQPLIDSLEVNFKNYGSKPIIFLKKELHL